MSVESAGGEDTLRVCMRDAHCPVCARPNHCRMETGKPYKGPCWCERPTLPAAALHRLVAKLPEPRCLCQNCLETIAANPEVTWDELVTRSHQPTTQFAVFEGDTYQEGDTIVFTEQFHLRRGHCCGNGCRHCPYTSTPRIVA